MTVNRKGIRSENRGQKINGEDELLGGDDEDDGNNDVGRAQWRTERWVGGCSLGQSVSGRKAGLGCPLDSLRPRVYNAVLYCSLPGPLRLSSALAASSPWSAYACPRLVEISGSETTPRVGSTGCTAHRMVEPSHHSKCEHNSQRGPMAASLSVLPIVLLLCDLKTRVGSSRGRHRHRAPAPLQQQQSVSEMR
ncbi:hypothetical protein BCV70DRAFT_204250 [Testicularia cyperi]|uniref:Uncharacterized protein n=1 Tax=Testicularia cyperi TaxID=1882483 RepID=A0A317XYW9_9BASI|nr:hypothetical protein BCV70DRAFT_204250 [Testicularia cyperi]